MKNFWQKCICFLLIVALMSSCSTFVTFDSNRPQEVTVNGKNIGTTPARVKLSDLDWEDYDVVYKDLETGQLTRFEADKEIKPGALVAGLLFFPILWPLLFWAYGPDDQQFSTVNPDYSSPNAGSGAMNSYAPQPNANVPQPAPSVVQVPVARTQIVDANGTTFDCDLINGAAVNCVPVQNVQKVQMTDSAGNQYLCDLINNMTQNCVLMNQ